MTALRVVIADDHPMYRDGIRALLAANPDAELVGEATTGDEAVALAAQARPDLVIMDVQMPGLDGIEATRRVVAGNPEVRVLVVTMFEDDATVFRAMCAGARGYVVKGAGFEEMNRAVQAVGSGEAIFSPGIAARLAAFFENSRPAAPPEAFPELSDREREILDLIAGGARNPEIAHRLYLSPKTVRNYVSSILGKLQVADRAQAAARARDAGLGQERSGSG